MTEQEKELAQLKMPKPVNEIGYTDHEIRKFMSKQELRDFSKWISGQTCGIDEDSGAYLMYTHDVIRFLKMKRHNIPTYWD